MTSHSWMLVAGVLLTATGLGLRRARRETGYWVSVFGAGFVGSGTGGLARTADVAWAMLAAAAVAALVIGYAAGRLLTPKAN